MRASNAMQPSCITCSAVCSRNFLVFNAGTPDRGASQPQVDLQQQSFTQSPLYAGKHYVSTDSTAQAAAPNPLRIPNNASGQGKCDESTGLDSASISPSPQSAKQVVTVAESDSPLKQYPDTPLYQFADIELAHHH